MKYTIEGLTKTEDIMRDYKVNSLLAKVLESKNMDLEDYHALINPKLTYHDFSLFSEGEMAVERIREAIDQHEKICIYGDYDCDGILATAIMVQAFHELNVKVGYHIPNRFEDGYGLNVRRVEQMADKGYSLIITVDNGIKSFDAVEAANNRGVDVIITDHHTFDEDDYPDAMSIVHTKLSQDYPFKEICGGFVAYKLAATLLGHHDPYLYSLAALTTVSDMMPLLDENRSLVKRGLSFMEAHHYPQLDLLLGNQKYSATSLGFSVAPKINAFGRLPEMVNPNNLVKYFQKQVDPMFLEAVAKNAGTINSKRQSLTNKYYEEALQVPHDDFLYYSSSNIHEGVVGLVAGKYARDYNRPSFVMNYDEKTGIHKGSARGVEGFNLYEFFTAHSDLLKQYGGHAMAGGFSVDEDHFDLLKQAIEEEIVGRSFEASQEVIPLTNEDLTIDNVESLDALEPFGQGNEAPKFILKDVLFDDIRQLSSGKHLRLDKHLSGCDLACLYFSQGERYEELKRKGPITCVGSLSINEYRGKKSINFIIDDILM
jgi:single-stranded-DNA-specific exonuclease